MSNPTQLQPGKVGLIQQQPDGRICQIGLTKDQSDLLQAFLSSISKESNLIRMPKEYDLFLQSQINKNNTK